MNRAPTSHARGSTATWRLIQSPPAHGARNMAVDEALLLLVSRGAGPALRFYTWSPGCYSIGRFQRAADLTKDARREPGVSWVRRPSGGRALYHGQELTYSLVAPLIDEHVRGSVLESYRQIAAALVAGLRALGVDAHLAPRSDARRASRNPSCFNSVSAFEVLHNGHKLVGSAQVRYAGALLQHGSILLGDPTTSHLAGLDLGSQGEHPNSRGIGQGEPLTTLAEALGDTPDVEDVRIAITTGFESQWGVAFAPAELDDYELEEAARLEATKYCSWEWSYLK